VLSYGPLAIESFMSRAGLCPVVDSYNRALMLSGKRGLEAACVPMRMMMSASPDE
jgi:hypothetical protein